MLQAEIYNIMKKKPKKWYTSKEINQFFENLTSNISTAMYKLYKGKYLIRQKLKKGNCYKYKIRELDDEWVNI